MLVLILQASSKDKVAQTVIESLVTAPGSRRNLLLYPFDWRTQEANYLAGSTTVVCICSKFRQEILDEEIERLKFHSEWGKVRLYNTIRDRGDYRLSLVRRAGCSTLPIFYAEDEHQSWQQNPSNT